MLIDGLKYLLIQFKYDISTYFNPNLVIGVYVRNN